MEPHKHTLPYRLKCLFTISVYHSAPTFNQNVLPKTSFFHFNSEKFYIIKEQIHSGRCNFTYLFTKIACFIIEDMIEAQIVFAPIEFFIWANKRDDFYSF